MTHITFTIFIGLSVFHVYMGLGLPLNRAAVIPVIKNKPLPFHSIFAIPVAILLALSAIAFAHETRLIGPLLYSILLEQYLWITGISLVTRGLGGLLIFHIFNAVIDSSPFKTWDRYLYSPLCLYLGIHCLYVLI